MGPGAHEAGAGGAGLLFSRRYRRAWSRLGGSEAERARRCGLKIEEYWVCPVCGQRIFHGEEGMTCDGTGNGRASYNPAARTRHEPAPLVRREAPDYTGRKVRVPGGVKLRYDTSAAVSTGAPTRAPEATPPPPRSRSSLGWWAWSTGSGPQAPAPRICSACARDARRRS